MERHTLQNLSNDELKNQMKKYRLITLIPLLSGLLVTLLLIWLDRAREFWSLLYLLLIVAMLPLLLKSGGLHREWRRRQRV